MVIQLNLDSRQAQTKQNLFVFRNNPIVESKGSFFFVYKINNLARKSQMKKVEMWIVLTIKHI